MTALNRKLIADMGRLRAQILAIAILIALGVGASLAMASAARSLAVAETAYYDEARFPDVFALVRRAPLTMKARVGAIPGVAEVDTTILTDVRAEIEGSTEPISGRLVSLPPGGERRLSRLSLRKGRLPILGRVGEVVVNEAFFKANQMKLEDRVVAVINGRRQELRIVGVAASPEYLYDVRPGEFAVDDKRDGVFWVEESALAAALDLQGAFNQITMRLTPDASVSAVIAAVDGLLLPYGGVGAYDRTRHPSAHFLDDKNKQLRKQADLIPIVFLAVSGYMLSFLLSRLVATQRQQIGTLKAIGYGDFKIGVHFAGFGVAIAALGVALGTMIGWPFGIMFTSMYFGLFHVPSTTYLIDWSVLGFVGALTLVVAMLCTMSSVRRAVRLHPAEAMRAEAPQSFKVTLADGLLIVRLLSTMSRMVLRQLMRYPLRASLSVAGIAAAIAVLISGEFLVDSVHQIAEVRFANAERYDVAVALRTPQAAEAVRELGRLPGAREVEPYRALFVRVQSGQHHRELGLLGLQRNSELLRVVDAAGAAQQMPGAGLLMSARLAQVLDVRVGDSVEIQSLELTAKRASLVVAGTVDDVVGMSCYADIETVQKLAGDGPLISGAFLSVDPTEMSALFSRLHGLPNVVGATAKSAEVAAFGSTTGKLVFVLAGIICAFGVLMAVAVVYNSAEASFLDRERELTMLRVLGYSVRETAFVAIGENMVHVVVAIPLGCVWGRGVASFLASAMQTDAVRLPVVVFPFTYLSACVVVVVSAVAIALVVARRTGKLDLLSALKAKD